ncbi:MAG: response regulator transcription factor, partial [Chloroflexi bacterium]|nr:response regulator transcription factor [Chloroflexota bacterium]
ISPRMAARMLQEFSRNPNVSKPGEVQYQSLTARETEVLRLVAAGQGNREIAAELFITESTVKYHLRKILDKLHLKNRAQVIAYVARRGPSPGGAE